MNANERLKILQESGVISGDVGAIMRSVLCWLSDRKIEMDGDNGQMFLTHLAMAIQRAAAEESVEALPGELLRQVEQSAHFSFAQEFLSFLDSLGVKLPESERGYVVLHVCSLLGGGE